MHSSHGETFAKLGEQDAGNTKAANYQQMGEGSEGPAT